MKKRWRLGTILGVEVWLTFGSILLSGGLWLIFTAVGLLWLELSVPTAVWVGFTAVILHWLGDLLHHLGHAWAARRVGYPMQRIVSWTVLFASVYPKDEPPLSAKIHIRRALGGPTASLLLTIISGALLFILPANNSPLFLLVAFFFWENLLVFFLGAFVPLGFTDGSTLLYWWPRRHGPFP